jgi:hypothetical protein
VCRASKVGREVRVYRERRDFKVKLATEDRKVVEVRRARPEVKACKESRDFKVHRASRVKRDWKETGDLKEM